MERVCLQELNMTNREEVLIFLKRLWNEENTDCPICGSKLEWLHKNNCDWQCRRCNKVYRTIPLLDELNERMPE